MGRAPLPPSWDLSDLYPGMESQELRRDLALCAQEAGAFRKAFRGRMAKLAPGVLRDAIRQFETIQERLARLTTYAQLVHAACLENPEYGRFSQKIHEETQETENLLLFVTLELNRLSGAGLEQRLAAPDGPGFHGPWLRGLRRFRPHELGEKLERFAADAGLSGEAAWIRLHDETQTAMRVPWQGGELTLDEALSRLEDPDRSTRQQLAAATAGTLKASLRLNCHIFNTLVHGRHTSDRWRKFAAPGDSRHLENRIPARIVDALEEAVTDAFPRTTHRYYRMKARWLGLEQLDYYDRNAPLPGRPPRRVPWDEARDLVLDAFRAFSPRMADIAGDFFRHGWIDAAPRPGKAGGAFSHPAVPSLHPWILMNYTGRMRDVMTLAHELGHGVHQCLARGQGFLMADTPLTIAETASVFGEQLTFRALLAREESAAARRLLLAGKVEDMINTIMRQIAFYRFEKRVHLARRRGETDAGEIARHWLDVQGESLGPAFVFHRDYEVYWSCIPHFFHTPFYVYAYAFGECLVTALYDVFEERGADDFVPGYLRLLEAGGSRSCEELLAPFGLDPGDPGFWRRGLGALERMIDALEAGGGGGLAPQCA